MVLAYVVLPYFNPIEGNIDINGNAIISEVNSDLYKVIRVVDGDTIIIDLNDKEEYVRFIGVDTPESVHPDPEKNTKIGELSSAFTKDHLEGKYVSIELDVQERDKYGRILAYVYLNDEMFNKALLAAGMAQMATFPPNVKYVDEFQLIQNIARDNDTGLWNYWQ